MGRFSSAHYVEDTGDKLGQSAYLAIITQLTSYLSNGVQAWELAHDFAPSPPVYDRVYLSKGDRTIEGGVGDALIWMRLRHNNGTMYFSTYRDFSTNSGTGTDQTTEASFAIIGAAPNNSLVNGVVSEYEAAFLVANNLTGGAYVNLLNFGIPIRSHIFEKESGIAFLSSGATASGSPVVLSVDRDVSARINAGRQKIWIWDNTPLGDALIAPNVVEAKDVTAVTATTITIASLTASRSVGATIGLDPGNTTVTVGGNGTGASYSLIGVDNSYVFTANRAMGIYPVRHYPVWFSQANPNTFGQREAYFVEAVHSSVATSKLRRGIFQHLIGLPEFGDTGVDEARIQKDDNQRYTYGWNVLNNSWDGGSNRAIGIGPIT